MEFFLCMKNTLNETIHFCFSYLIYNYNILKAARNFEVKILLLLFLLMYFYVC